MSQSNRFEPFSLLLLGLLSILIGCNAPQKNEAPHAPQPQDSIIEIRVTAEEPEPIRLSRLDYDTTEWTDILILDSTVLVDMKYATEENFVETKMYECSRCFLRPEVAKSVVAVQQELRQKGLGLKMLDCFRPRPIQQKLWDKVPDPRFVTNPEKGSMHNRGAAVDLTIVDSLGNELNMGTAFDHFGPEAYHAYTELPDSVLANRKLLKETMIAHGFKPIRTEWWHYSFPGLGYPLSDMLWKCY